MSRENDTTKILNVFHNPIIKTKYSLLSSRRFFNTPIEEKETRTFCQAYGKIVHLRWQFIA